jgi:acetyltransferase-like isoleucine patch superfamily enzyme
MYFLGSCRFYGLLLRTFMNFDYMGKNVRICPSCEIRKGAAPYIYLGNNISLGKDVWLNIPYEASPHIKNMPILKINDGVAIGRRCMITALNGIEIGCNVLFGPGVFVADHSHEFSDKDRPIIKQGVTVPGRVIIEEGCWLGYQCAVVTHKGREVRIGRNTVIGANAVVTKSCPPYSVLVGNPARDLRVS